MDKKLIHIINVFILVLAGASCFLFFKSLQPRSLFLETICQSQHCLDSDQLTLDLFEKFHQSGWTISFYAFIKILLDIITAIGFSSVACFIFYKSSRNFMALYTFLLLIMFGTSYTTGALAVNDPFWEWPVKIQQAICWVLFIPFFFLFPNGKFTPKWTVYIALFWVITEIPYQLFPNSPLSSLIWPNWLSTILFFSFWICCIFAQIYRYKKRANKLEKQQTKWFIFALIVLVLGIFIGGSIQLVPNSLSPLFISTFFIITQIIKSLSLIVIPISIAYAILNHSLWSIDVILSRTIKYLLLTFSIIALHVIVVGGLGTLFQAQGNILISLISTGFIALLFHPMTLYFQRLVNRLIYGERDDPFQLLVRLGERLEGTLPVEEILPNLLESIVTALRLPYAQVILKNDESYSHGSIVEVYHGFPLIYQGEKIGLLNVGMRSAQDRFTTKDINLLNHLSRQISAAAHSVLTISELKASRKMIVSSREEERKRLRRDLHDGIGPSLAAQTIKVGVARQLLLENPEACDKILSSLETDLGQTLTEIRHIIYNLRPPSLDDLGLIGAVSEFMSQIKKPVRATQTDGCQYYFNHPSHPITELSAATQVAAYRIIQESLTNVIRHSQATFCVVELIEEQAGIKILITDNGRGLPLNYKKGIGFISMQERASEIGGFCRIYPSDTGGTIVNTYLPF